MKKTDYSGKRKRVLLNISNKRWLNRLKSERARRARRSRPQPSLHIQAYPSLNSFQRVLRAPAVFSFTENSSDSILFVDKLNQCIEKRTTVYVDLSHVKELTYDSILVLLSIMYQFKKKRIAFNGNFPIDPGCSQKLRLSGFFENLYEERVPFHFNASQEHLIRKFGKMAEPEEASRIVSNCHKNIWGVPGRCKGVFRIILELMQNTHAHANLSQPGAENWWFGVNYDATRNVECFSFIDYGVGVFTSLENKLPGTKFYKALEKMKRIFGISNNATALQHIMAGDLHRTSTGQSYRGKGLPGIKDALNREQISRLVVITNDVRAEVNNDNYELLPRSFSGSFIYWELSEKCKYHYADNNS